mmetsp:Transcript_17206/g.33752  ORF Transcript_17206/g.33752 Transcript_17206/m.33752 type:complete len:400 (-) Transcript_17206:1540-2739(-)
MFNILKISNRFDAWFPLQDKLGILVTEPEFEQVQDYGTASLRAAAWNLCLADATKSMRVLEVGGGNGARLGQLKRYNALIETQVVKTALPADLKGLPGQAFDAVAMWYQLNPAMDQASYENTFQAIFNRLVPGGWFFGEFLVAPQKTMNVPEQNGKSNLDNQMFEHKERQDSNFLTGEELRSLLQKVHFQDVVIVPLSKSWKLAVQVAHSLKGLPSFYRELVLQEELEGVRILCRRNGVEMTYKASQDRQLAPDGAYLRAACLCIRQTSKTPGRYQVLLVRRRSKGRNKWSLPGGGLEPGERPCDAAVREAYEEAGVIGTLGACLGEFSNISKKSNKVSRTTAFVFHTSEFLDDGLWPESLLRARQWFNLESESLEQIIDKSHDLAIAQNAIRHLSSSQ